MSRSTKTLLGAVVVAACLILALMLLRGPSDEALVDQDGPEFAAY